MKPIKQSFRLLCALAVSVALSGCVFEDLDPCPTGVSMRFVFEYNTEQANAFPSQVDCLTLHVYDSDGIYVTTVTETSTALADENWRLNLELPAGCYHAVAYGGIACSEADFAHTAVPASGSRYEDIAMALSPRSAGTRLHDHFHGALDFEVEADSPQFTAGTMKMTKTTNHYRILLQHIDGAPVDGGEFTYTITDDNSRLDHLNRPVKGNSISYDAHSAGSVSTADVWARSLTEVTAAYGELSTSRLWLPNDNYLIIRHGDDEIVRLPLNTYLLMSMQEDEQAKWGPQEFLDRCSRWNMVFFLDSGNRWVMTHILVNGWTVHINNLEM